MIQGIGRGIVDAVFAAIVGAFVAGVGVGVLLTTGLPALWRWLKPLIHSLTA